jgi:hypothetical protein
MSVGVMKDCKLKQRNLRASHTQRLCFVIHPPNFQGKKKPNFCIFLQSEEVARRCLVHDTTDYRISLSPMREC